MLSRCYRKLTEVTVGFVSDSSWLATPTIKRRPSRAAFYFLPPPQKLGLIMNIRTRNVNTAFTRIVTLFETGEQVVRRPSRNGSVLMIDEPMLITYSHPKERLLFNSARDANPFFHLYESLWMLAGRNDVASVAYYAKQINEYSDDGITLNGAYGYRWRSSLVPRTALGDTESLLRNTREMVDQLDVLVNHLKADPTSRRAVLQMWNVEDDLLKIGQILEGPYTTKHEAWLSSKDVCCNLSVMFSLREVPTCCEATTVVDGRTFRCGIDADHPSPHKSECGEWLGAGTGFGRVLDMTVTNRSNDLVWGMLGANYVHFTMLQEYMAARIGVEVGRYHHFTNNLHCYTGGEEGDESQTNQWHPDKWLAHSHLEIGQSGYLENYKSVPLVKDPQIFDREVKEFVECNHNSIVGDQIWQEPFLMNVARPMCRAFFEHKSHNKAAALEWANKVAADDWRKAAIEWLGRRQNKAKKTTV